MQCSHRFPSFGRFECVLGLFWPKNGCFGPKLQFLKLRSATCESRFRPPLSSFLLKLCVISKISLKSEAPRRSSDFFPFRACCLLLAACLLACCLLAKPGRSTLDTKKGYKTKTGSTTSVTLTLTWCFGISGCSYTAVTRMYRHGSLTCDWPQCACQCMGQFTASAPRNQSRIGRGML